MCEEYLDDISLLVDDMLDTDEKKDILLHLNTCSACKQVHDNLLALKEGLNNLDDIVYPENLHQSIMSKIDGVREESNSIPVKSKVVKVDFKNRALYAVASVIGFMVVCTPIASNMLSRTVPQTTVMADDLKLTDHLRIFGQSPILEKSVSVSVPSSNVGETYEDLVAYANSIGEVTNENNLENVATFTIETDIDNAPQIVSYIVDNYDDAQYVTKKSKIEKSQLEEVQSVVSKNLKVDDSKFENEKEFISDKSNTVTINVTIH